MAQSGKMSLPVDSSSLIYSHFEHVSGIPAPKGAQGVSISKLNLLDVLIGQLNQVKKGPNSLPKMPSDLQQMQDLSADARPVRGSHLEKNLDALIENYKNQIRQAKAASAAMPYIQSPSAQPGVLFSLFT